MGVVVSLEVVLMSMLCERDVNLMILNSLRSDGFALYDIYRLLNFAILLNSN